MQYIIIHIRLLGFIVPYSYTFHNTDQEGHTFLEQNQAPRLDLTSIRRFRMGLWPRGARLWNWMSKRYPQHN